MSYDVRWLYEHRREILRVDQETLKQNLIRLVESPVIKGDDSLNATSITVESVESSFPSDGKTQVSFVVPWTTADGNARTDHSGTWQANLEKAADKYCHVTGVAVRTGDAWIKAINTDFEINSRCARSLTQRDTIRFVFASCPEDNE